MQICAEHFKSGLSSEVAQQLFKGSVLYVEMAISSYCNRVCDYCPNSLVDRRSQKNNMADGLFFNIMRQLSKIDYSGIIHLHRYNEPLVDLDYALSRIRDIRKFIPTAKIDVSTNGDYLNQEAVFLLRDAGVNSLLATSHAPPGVTDFDFLRHQLNKRLQTLGLPYSYVEDIPDQRLSAYVDAGAGMLFEYRTINFFYRDELGHLNMSDRGQSLSVGEVHVRERPCLYPFTQMQIEWDGRLQPCCHIHADVPFHQQFSLGKITADSDLFLTWTSENYVAWRKAMFSYKLKHAPCTSCTSFTLEDTPEIRQQVAAIRAQFIGGDD